MTRVVGLAGSPGVRQGYRVHTQAQGDEYVTTLRRTDDEERTVEVTERYRVDGDTGDREDLDLEATEAVEEALEDRGVTVA